MKRRPVVMTGKEIRQRAGYLGLTGGTFWLYPQRWLMGNEAILQGTKLSVSFHIPERYASGESHNDILDSLTVWVFDELPENEFMHIIRYN